VRGDGHSQACASPRSALSKRFSTSRSLHWRAAFTAGASSRAYESCNRTGKSETWSRVVSLLAGVGSPLCTRARGPSARPLHFTSTC